MFIKLLALVVVSAICVSSKIAVQPQDQQVNYKYAGCHERWTAGEREPGLYDIYPNTTKPFKVFCNFTEQAAFVVIQRRVDHQVSFYRGWQDYKRGFGDPQGNYWAGLDLIHHLTYTGYNTLRIDMTDWSRNNRYIAYNHFSIQDERNFYTLTISPAAKGNVHDDLAFSNGMRFATYDYYDAKQCAVNQKAGWWYNYCSYALPNGVYYYGGPYTPSGAFYDGIYWKDWLGYAYSLKSMSMTLYKY